MVRSVFTLLLVALLCCQWTPLSAQTIEIEINNTPAESDDYLGWTPIRSQVRLVGGAADMNVTLESSKRLAGGAQGEVQFAAFTASPLTPASFTPVDSLAITLPQTGAWKGFWIAGKLASSDGKDVKVLVKDSMGAVLKEHTVMVRVRKNAESLTDTERDRFLEALAALHDVNNNGANSKYYKYVKTHSDAFYFGIHQSPSFPTWHRAFLLSLERELQTIDPRVALPYWKFDEPAPKLFHRKFMGVVTSSSVIVDFDSTNPLNNWRMPNDLVISSQPGLTPIPLSNEKMVRGNNAGSASNIPDVDYDSVSGQSTYTQMRVMLEGNYHNEAHNHINGWLASGSSPRDPLFFLLHANVDRAWAQWQSDSTPRATLFFPLGTYSPGGEHYGNFGSDTVWPFNGLQGNQGTSDDGDDWPGFSFSLPSAFANHGPGALVIDLVDSLVISGIGQPHGAYYDTVRFK